MGIEIKLSLLGSNCLCHDSWRVWWRDNWNPGTEGVLNLDFQPGGCRFKYAIVKVKIANRLYVTYKYILHIDISPRVNYHFQNKQKLQVLWHRPKYSRTTSASLELPCDTLRIAVRPVLTWRWMARLDTGRQKGHRGPFYETPSEHMDVSQKGKINFNLHLWCIQKVSRHNMKWFTLSENVKTLLTKLNPRSFPFSLSFSWHGKQSLPCFLEPTFQQVHRSIRASQRPQEKVQRNRWSSKERNAL